MSTAARALVSLVLLLLVAGAAYWAGDRHRNNAWLADQAKSERDAHDKYEAEVKRGNDAAASFLESLADQEDRYAQLENRFEALRKRIPLLVPPGAAPAAQAAAAGPDSCVNLPGAPAQVDGVAVQPELSLGAVWMWNSALAGADVPAGACGADAQTVEACAAGSGLTTADAWDNHTANAKSCAADRLRLERLIDYLERRQPASH
jgi:hypothetical protein